MNLFFAELPPPNDYASIGWVCVILVSILVGLNHGFKFWRNIKDKPSTSEALEIAAERFQPKGNYQPAGDYAMRSELAQLKTDLVKGQEKLSDENADIFKAGEKRERHLSEQINSVDRKVAGLEASTVFQNQQLVSANTDIKRILERLPKE